MAIGEQTRTRSSRSKAATGARTSTMEAVATAMRAARMRVANWEKQGERIARVLRTHHNCTDLHSGVFLVLLFEGRQIFS